jgi:tripartite-type tricarboxylate transporter receptor subunit TctC
MKRRSLILLASASPLGPGSAALAPADWPSRPVRIVVPLAAGDNAGATEVANAAADGCTFLMGPPGTQAINQFRYSKMPYDSAKDLARCAGLALGAAAGWTMAALVA